MSIINRRVAVITAVIVLLALWLLLSRCKRTPSAAPMRADAPTAAVSKPTSTPPGASQPSAVETPEALSAATLQAPASVGAGTAFSVTWIGPNNASDYLTIIRRDASASTVGAYTLTRSGSPLQMTAPIEPGSDWEIRYVAGKSRKILGRTPLTVTASGVTLKTTDSVTLDTPLSIEWIGPGNAGDFITIVARDAADRVYGAYALTSQGSPLKVTAPPVIGDAEIRYVSGQGAKVLARRPVKITLPNVTLSAPAEAIAGSIVAVTWTGPANDGDYITVVPQQSLDGHHANYTTVSSGSPLKLKMPMEPGSAELRYMTGRGGKVIGRRPIRIHAPDVSLSAPASAAVNAPIDVTWIGPANEGDYITIVPRGAPDLQHGPYTLTNQGSPLKLAAPKESGEAELRYISGQGGKVLARRPISLTP
jgi:hypothetical protein